MVTDIITHRRHVVRYMARSATSHDQAQRVRAVSIFIIVVIEQLVLKHAHLRLVAVIVILAIVAVAALPAAAAAAAAAAAGPLLRTTWLHNCCNLRRRHKDPLHQFQEPRPVERHFHHWEGMIATVLDSGRIQRRRNYRQTNPLDLGNDFLSPVR